MVAQEEPKVALTQKAEQKLVLDDHEAAELLGIGRVVLRKAVRAGTVPGQIVGNRFIFHRPTLLDWLSNGRGPAPAASPRRPSPSRSAPGKLRRPPPGPPILR